MKYPAVALAAFLVAACTVNNPYWTGGPGPTPNDGGVPDQATSKPDLRSPPDLEPACVDGTRECVGPPAASRACESGAFHVDRECPANSDCASGYCLAPPMNGLGQGEVCSRENDCTAFATALSCQPFVTPGTRDVTWSCANHIGPGLPGDACTTGRHCRSGFCGGNGTCLRTCQNDFDCPAPLGRILRCLDTTFVVEGVSSTTLSCR